jgi:hypothetical protein
MRAAGRARGDARAHGGEYVMTVRYAKEGDMAARRAGGEGARAAATRAQRRRARSGEGARVCVAHRSQSAAELPCTPGAEDVRQGDGDGGW